MTDGNKRYLHASVVTVVPTFAYTVISRSQHCLFNQAVFQEHIFTGYIFCKIVSGNKWIICGNRSWIQKSSNILTEICEFICGFQVNQTS